MEEKIKELERRIKQCELAICNARKDMIQVEHDPNFDDMLNAQYKEYAKIYFEKYLDGEIGWGQFVDKINLPLCSENILDFVRRTGGQDVIDRVYREGRKATAEAGLAAARAMEQVMAHPTGCHEDDGNADVKNDSLYKLLGYQVICFLKHGESRCEQCPFNPNDPEDCVKVELVGGHYLCLAPLPNSVVTE